MLTERVKEKLLARFSDMDQTEIIADDGSCSSGSKLTVSFISTTFEGLSRIDRHRLVHEAISIELQQEIHSLTIRVKAPSEVKP